MFGKAARRTIDIIVLLFATYAFAFVPLGRRTGLEHARAILGTTEAQFAGDELKQAGGRLMDKFSADDLKPRRKFKGDPVVPQLPEPTSKKADPDAAEP